MPDSRTLDTGTGNITTTVLVNGDPLPPEVNVYSCMVLRELNRLSRARLSFIDGSAAESDFELSNTGLFVPGNTIEVQAGYDSDEEVIFRGIVIKQNIRIREQGQPLLTVEARHEAVKMTLTRRSRYFYEMSDSEAIEELTSGYGLSSEVEDTGFAHQQLVQYESTDWDFMISRAEANGLFCDPGNEQLAFRKPDFNQDSVHTLLYGATMMAFDAEMDARSQHHNVRSFSWDPANQEVSEQEGEPPAGKLSGNLDGDDLSDALDAEDYLQHHGGRISDSESGAWADARSMRSKLARITGRVRFRGLPDVEPASMITLEGVGERFNGNVFVTAVRHSISGGTWHTDAQFGCDPERFTEQFPVSGIPATGVLPAVHGLQVGVVTQLEDDPEGEERILVRLPIVDPEEQGIWARVAGPDAGEERGVFFRPEIGDEVIVGFINSDPRQAIVLGGLHSSAKPGPLALSDDNHQKGVVTRSNIKTIYDDDKRSVKIRTPDGKTFSLNDDEGTTTLEDDNGNKLLMDSNGISMESNGDITLKCNGKLTCEGTEISNSANGQFKAEGSGGAEVSSSAATVIKGSIVQIN